MKTKYTLIPICALSALLLSCGEKEKNNNSNTTKNTKKTNEHNDDHHHHDEVSLGSHNIDGITVEAAQGHGAVEAGKEEHIVIKLPYSDKGETVVRAWIGTADKTLSSAGKGSYAPSHDDYDIHVTAPKPLPADAQWWLEISKPDGTKVTGSIPLLKNIKK